MNCQIKANTDNLSYIINVEINISIRDYLSLGINSVSLVFICHQDSPVTQSSMLKYHTIDKLLRRKSKSSHLSVGSSTSM